MPAKYNAAQTQEKECDDSYMLLKCDDQYLSLLLMPFSLYDKLADVVIQADVDYFWGLQGKAINNDAYPILRDQLFKYHGKRVSLKGTEWSFWLLGSIPEQLLPYLKTIKE